MTLPAADLHLRETEGGRHFWEGRFGGAVMWAVNGGKVNIIFNLLILFESPAFAGEPSFLPRPSSSPPPRPPPRACDRQNADVMTREAAVWVPQEFQPSVTTVCVWLMFVSLHARR